jgi:uncharacterized membrane protein YphA (DoxX/SURF4 family)
MMKLPNDRSSVASLLIRLGLGSVLLYAGISSLVSPAEWLGYLPQFLTTRFTGNGLLYAFAVYELLLALWLLSGAYLRYAAGLAALTFAGIIFTNLAAFSTITFRDVPMVFAALALLVLAW